MATINASREVSAPLDKVWDIVSDVDHEPEYWHGTKTVKNISKTGNTIEREVTIAFKDSKCLQTVVLNPKKSVQITITQGPMKGTKIVSVSASGDKTKIDVVWDIKLAGFLGMFTGMVKKHIAEGTEEALERIAKAVE
ncbi:MAG TPA: SRPBCC family protein [Nitrososphaera sp.]|jgi:carbon monoxide dehydrogenase subunit G|nr:SRPBCC family protein [Nitrososphaera sp.]